MGSQAITSSNWAGHFAVTTDNTKVAAAVGNLVYDLSNAPAAFWANVKTDGGDIRITNQAGDTAYSYHLENFSVSSQTGLLHFNAVGLQTESDTTYLIHAGNASANLPDVSDTLGRDNVWESGVAAVWGFDEDPTSDSGGELVDWTGRGHDLTTNGAMLTEDLVDADGGKGWAFDGSNDYGQAADHADFNSDDFSILARIKMPANAATMQVINKTEESGGAVYEWNFRVLSDGTVNVGQNISAGGAPNLTASSAGVVDDDAPHTIGTSIDADVDLYIYIDGSEDGNDTTPAGSPYHSVTPVGIGARALSGGQPYAGIISFLIYTTDARSAAWHLTHHNNLHDSDTFWSTGAWSATEPPETAPRHLATLHPMKPLQGVA